MFVKLVKSRNYNYEQRTMNYELLFKTNPILSASGENYEQRTMNYEQIMFSLSPIR
jgi:hypothetical protein